VWARSQGREDLVGRPPPEALVQSVSESLERQRTNGADGSGVDGYAELGVNGNE
jgi:hypothetical protein